MEDHLIDQLTISPGSLERDCTMAGDAGEFSVCTLTTGAPGAASALVQDRAWLQSASASVADALADAEDGVVHLGQRRQSHLKT